MDNLLIELDYIKSHFPDFMVSLIPKAIIGVIVIQIILLFVWLNVRKADTEKSAQTKGVVTTVSFVLWAGIAVLTAMYVYYYIKLGL